MKVSWRSASKTTLRVLERASLGLLVGLFVIVATPVSEWLAEPLRIEEEPESADLIVVLGAFATVNGILNEPALRRTKKAAELYADGYAPRVLFTGGNDGRPEGRHTADHMARFAEQLGVPRGSILVETAARNTHDNAEKATEICASQGCTSILLVSDMAHLRRAKACFRSILRVHAVASNRYSFYWTTPEMRLARFHAALYEHAALLYYRWRGWV